MTERHHPDKSIRVAIIQDIGETSLHIKKLLTFSEEIDVIGYVVLDGDIINALKELNPDCIIWCFDQRETHFTLMKQVTKAIPVTGIIFISYSNDKNIMQQAMLSGARFFLNPLLQPDQLISTIQNVYQEYQSIRTQFASVQQGMYVEENQAKRDKTQRFSGEMEDVQFTAYAPGQAKISQRYALVVYAHTNDTMSTIQSDVERFKQDLGDNINNSRTAKQTSTIKRGTPVTIVPECDELRFEPQSMTKSWHGEWTRYLFDFTPIPELVDELMIVRVSIQIAGIEVAHIRLAIEIIDSQTHPERNSDNPLYVSKLNTSHTSELYHNIFVSYSRKDKEVVEAYRLAQIALGNDVFMDTHSIRSGENWQAALAKAIDKADIFQLFWSESSSASDNCRDEWDYALQQRCPDDHCATFIRPVYWQQPLQQTPPPELSHLNFRYVPLQEHIDDTALYLNNTSLQNVIAVYSPVSGAGKTLIASNLAIQLAQMGHKTLLVDCDVLFGDVGLMLDIRHHRTITDAVKIDGTLNTDELDMLYASYRNNLDVILAPRRTQEGLSILDNHSQLGVQLIQHLQSSYDYIILDLNGTINDFTSALLEITQQIILLGLPTLAAIKNIRLIIDIFDEAEYPHEKTILALNKVVNNPEIEQAYVPREKVEKYLKFFPVEQEIPLIAEGYLLQSIVQRIPIIESDLEEVQPFNTALISLASHIHSKVSHR